jgi:HEAT repeat protein
VKEKICILRNAPAAIKQAVAELDAPDLVRRRGAVESLAQINHPMGREALAASAQHLHRDVRIHAAFMLAQFGDERAVPGLIEALQDTLTPVGVNAVRSVRRMVERDYFTGMEALAESGGKLPEENWSVSDTAQWALVQFKGAAVSGLLQALRSRDRIVREVAKRILPQIQEPSVVAGLIEDLSDGDRTVRWEAIWILTQIDDITAAQSRLIDILDDEDEDPSMHMAAQLALSGIDTKEAQGAVEEWKRRQRETPQPQRTASELLEEARRLIQKEQSEDKATEQPEEFVRIEFEDDNPLQLIERDRSSAQEANPSLPDWFPNSEKTLAKWKRAYSIVVQLREEYREAYVDGDTDYPEPRIADCIDAIASEMGWKRSYKTVERIIKTGDEGLLGD